MVKVLPHIGYFFYFSRRTLPTKVLVGDLEISYDVYRGGFGGIMVGLSAAVMLLCNGKDSIGTADMMQSIILSPWTTIRNPAMHWKLVFMTSFFWTIYYSVLPEIDPDKILPLVESNVVAHVLGAFLFGLGTVLSDGCPLSHCICGLSRFEWRSVVAVPIFAFSAWATARIVYAKREFVKYMWILQDPYKFIKYDLPHVESYKPEYGLYVAIVLTVMTAIALLFFRNGPTQFIQQQQTQQVDQQQQKRSSILSYLRNTSLVQLGPAAIAGAMLSFGMDASQFNYAKLVQDCLLIVIGKYGKTFWDPTLFIYYGSAMLVNFVANQFVMVKPLVNQLLTTSTSPTSASGNSQRFNNTKDVNKSYTLKLLSSSSFPYMPYTYYTTYSPNSLMDALTDTDLVVGAICYGMSYGLVGLCATAAMVDVALGSQLYTLYWFPSFIVGSYVGTLIKL